MAKSRKLTFDEWKRRVNMKVHEQLGLSCDDLPDIDYYSMYDSGMSVTKAAQETIAYAMEN